MKDLMELLEYDSRLNRRLTDFGRSQRIMEKNRQYFFDSLRQENFLDNADKAYENEKDQEAVDSYEPKELLEDKFIKE